MPNDLVSRVRRNHALEHATINVLSEHHKGFSAQGNSTHRGFHLNIYGDVTEDNVHHAIGEAHRRLSSGEGRLGLHANCGTVLLTSATLAVMAAQATFSLEQRRQKQPSLNLTVLFGALPAAILAVTIALIVSRPIGMIFQEKFTVESDIGELQVTKIAKREPSPITRLFQYLLGQARNDQVNAYRIETVG